MLRALDEKVAVRTLVITSKTFENRNSAAPSLLFSVTVIKTEVEVKMAVEMVFRGLGFRVEGRQRQNQQPES